MNSHQKMMKLVNNYISLYHGQVWAMTYLTAKGYECIFVKMNLSRYNKVTFTSKKIVNAIRRLLINWLYAKAQIKNKIIHNTRRDGIYSGYMVWVL